MNGQKKSEVTKGVPGKQEKPWNLFQDSTQLTILDVLILKSAAAKYNNRIIHYLLRSYNLNLGKWGSVGKCLRNPKVFGYNLN